MSDVVDLAKALISCETVSPVEDEQVFQPVIELLEETGVEYEILEFNGVKNLVAESGAGEPSICFNGHMDVVDASGDWDSDPFDPVEKDGRIYGRGSADMKGAMAAEILAFLDLHRDNEFDGCVTLMCVGDEEIGGFNGTEKIVEQYYDDGKSFEYPLTGEPTGMNIQTGTRGVLWLDIILNGDGAHGAKPHHAEVHTVIELRKLLERLEDLEMSYSYSGSLPEPTAEVTRIDMGEGGYNSIPEKIKVGMDIRYLPVQTPESIVEDIKDALSDLKADFSVEIWENHGGAFEIEDGEFLEAVHEAVEGVTGREPEHITSGGASDGRFFDNRGDYHLTVGANREPPHQVNEYVDKEKLRKLRKIYYRIGKRLDG